jgi:adhesin/invasin
VTLASSLGTVGAATDIGNGTYTAVFTSTVPGTATISATVDGTPIDNTAQVTVGVGASSPATSTITASPSSITTDGSSTITIAFKDAHGNPAPLDGATFTLSSDTGLLGPVTDNGDNSYSATFTTDVPGTVTMSGTLDGVPLVSTATVVVGLPGVASAATSTISASRPRSRSAAARRSPSPSRTPRARPWPPAATWSS